MPRLALFCRLLALAASALAGAQPDLVPHGVNFDPEVADLGQTIEVHIDVRCWGQLPDRGFRVGFWRHEPRAPVIWPWQRARGRDPREHVAPEFLAGPDHCWLVGPKPERHREPLPNVATWLQKGPECEPAELIVPPFKDRRPPNGMWQAREATNRLLLRWRFQPQGAGLRTPWVAVDAFDDVKERDERNNLVHSEYEARGTGQPDLQIVNFAVTPNPTGRGEEVVYSVTVANFGNTAAGPFLAHLWYHRNGRPRAGITGSAGASHEWPFAEGLRLAQEVTVVHTVKAARVGQCRAWVLLDSDSRVRENDEENNVQDARHTVRP